MVVVAAQNELHFLSCPAQPYRLPASSRHSQRSHFPVLLSKKFRSLTRTTKRKKLFISVPNVWMERRGEKSFWNSTKLILELGARYLNVRSQIWPRGTVHTRRVEKRSQKSSHRVDDCKVDFWRVRNLNLKPNGFRHQVQVKVLRPTRFLIVSRNILSNPMSKERHQKQSSLIFSSFIWKYYS